MECLVFGNHQKFVNICPHSSELCSNNLTMRFIDFTGGSLPNHVLRIQNSILSGMLNADQGAWVSRQSHLRSQLSPFQATRIAVSSCPILRSAHLTNFRQTAVMPSALTIDWCCGEGWFLLMACGHHLMSLSGLTYSFGVPHAVDLPFVLALCVLVPD